jgi:multiple sugar transport system substrate-binding protein
VSVWAWYGAFKEVAELFNSTHDDVQVCWTGQAVGNDAYTRLNTALEAGTGAPDVAMIEAEVISGYVLRDALVDLSEYGAAEVAQNYPAGWWKNVSVGDGVYGIPVDGGPMGLLYRQDIFDEYGIEVPTTWDEFAAAAQALADAGAPGVLADYPTNGRAFNQALFIQAGASPFAWDPADPATIGIELNDPASVDTLTFWLDLIDRGLIAADDAFTTDYNTKLATGGYAAYVAAAWGAGYLSGIADQDPDAEWRAAPIPQWDPESPVAANWGGSAFAVTGQADDPALAAQVAMELYGTEEAWRIGIEQANIFPVWSPILESDYFRSIENPLFGGQTINDDVFLEAASSYEGTTFSPIQNYVYDQQTEQLAAASRGEKSAQQALDDLQAAVVAYAEQQGFTVE